MSKTAAIARRASLPARHVVTALSADELLETLRELVPDLREASPDASFDADATGAPEAGELAPENVVIRCASARATRPARWARPSTRVPLAPASPADAAELCERFGLSDRQAEVARLLAAGHSNAEIGERLGLSTYTARNHAARVLHKLGIRRRSGVGLAILAEDGGERPEASD